MPKRTDIHKILIIGSGPIVIGQACEFDYSGTQACKALRQEGYKVVLVNSNPATIMTDPETADVTYIEPLTVEAVSAIIRLERPDALLPTVGGQTALNLAIALDDSGVLEECGVEMIGAKREAIRVAEDRMLFKQAMDEAGMRMPRGGFAKSWTEAQEIVEHTGYPAIIRPSFTLGGTGGGTAYNPEEFEEIVRAGLAASPMHEVLVEESILGWKEFELEVMRDLADNVVIICSIENFDPMGVHTGDSITVAPAQTLTDREYQLMRDMAITIIRKVGVETGGSNIQFSVNPENGDIRVIEMNPRVSRSSALASKATGFPIAKIAAKLAVGYTLDEIPNDITRKTPASFEPTIDYVVAKIPKWDFEKFREAEDVLGTQMKSVGEVMAIGRTFKEALFKGLRSLEAVKPLRLEDVSTDELQRKLARPNSQRFSYITYALQHDWPISEIYRLSRVDPWFLEQLQDVMEIQKSVEGLKLEEIPVELLRSFKEVALSDRRLAYLTEKSEDEVREFRKRAGVVPVYKRVDTCGAEFESFTPYLYSTYETENEAAPTDRRKIMILGSGPNRIGQGIEFDYCCCHAAFSLSAAGYETIMINCNPETVSTDYDTSDRLYFEPLTAEDVLAILDKERERGLLKGVIVQFGGQTPLKLAHVIEQSGAPILGTSVDSIDLAEDRDRFKRLLDKLGLKQPKNGIAYSVEQSRLIAADLGLPLVVRPSYVLGGRAMAIIHDQSALDDYLLGVLPSLVPSDVKARYPNDKTGQINTVLGKNPLLFDRYLSDATEIDVDCLCDGKDTFVVGIMEHIEEAGIHSGDSACALPPHSLDAVMIGELERQTRELALGLDVVGLMNVQYAIKDGEIYVLEVNPRASRTVPFVAKVMGMPVAKIAARIMAGEKLADFKLKKRTLDHVGVKESVFPFTRFPGVDTVLGPEMRSTGEVMGIDGSFEVAFAKSQLGGGTRVPRKGTVFVSVREIDKTRILEAVRLLFSLGFKVLATSGTQRFLADSGVPTEKVNKVLEGRPHIVDAITNGDIQLVFNTTEGPQALADSRSLRRAALLHKVPYYTTLSGAVAAAQGIRAYLGGDLEVRTLQSYFSET